MTVGITCDYCGGAQFVREPNGFFVCAGCGAPAQADAVEVIFHEPKERILFMKGPVLPEDRYERIRETWQRILPDYKFVYYEPDFELQFIGSKND